MRRLGGRPSESGSALLPVLILVILSMILVGAYFSASLATTGYVEQKVAEAEAFNAAESGLSTVTAEVWSRFRAANFARRVPDLDPLDGKGDPADQLRVEGKVLGGSAWSVAVNRVSAVGRMYADVEFVAKGENRRASRTIRSVVRFSHEPSQVFDYVYFINNFGWLWGSSITVNGDVRSNGNFSMRNSTVNGDIYASWNEDLGTTGTIEGASRHRDTDWYTRRAGDRTRPTNPTAPPEDANANDIIDPGEDRNENGVLDDFDYELGYDGESERLPGQQALPMPYLGSLDTYEQIAIDEGGTLSQGGTTLVTGVLGDDPGEPVNLVVVGTRANPIRIDGPVVIRNDAVLRGVITGQGTIYAGRNVHLIGDLTYANPPTWPKPMENQDAIRERNASRDLVGLTARGSVVMGDYTQSWWRSATGYYQRPPFTQPYVVDPADEDIGYVTGTDRQGRPTFHGNYTSYDGGRKTDGTRRRYYESSIPTRDIRRLSTGMVHNVDAIIYTNHLLTGRIGATRFNGSIISRDEAIIYSGWIEMNYDVRTRRWGEDFLDIFLPREPSHRVLFWNDRE